MEAITAPAHVPEASDLPRFPVGLEPPDITPWLAGNTGLPGFTSFAATRSGPHVLIISLMHGNEIAGAIAIDALLRAGIRPERGRLTLGFGNIEAFARFDAGNPIASRFIDEDMNRVWDIATLEGPRSSRELQRARAMRSVVDSADWVLDLHSMLWPSDPLLLCGQGTRGKTLALTIGTPNLVVADCGHAGGKRLIDYPRFTAEHGDAASVLVEAGQHWQTPTVAQMTASITALLHHAGMLPNPPQIARTNPPRFAEVTRVVTATTGRFAFVRPFRGGEIIPTRDTILAYDGIAEVRTPHDQCLLVMPSHRTGRGHTAVRLAKFL
ncbi:succinylglutamate desuccinylase/aspartoacylase family protein [Acidiphilium sp. PA]|uniref:succinylglutamate desuccinylase/aspartoacylase domain-containing protein n=1 Tax=Acidiphilium sp. PA TaxID=2871705 RepID=UPI002242E6BE|nr:succinylglutamate desuccinylase/aspartoacylase family protein [Acidiphilium sp. PA]MCW8307477.1 succinylglutamate desuccinylase/aspartoacylase family protein [Acidiphilium sp. PA]